MSSILKAKSHYEMMDIDYDNNLTRIRDVNRGTTLERNATAQTDAFNEKSESIITEAVKKSQHIESEAKKRASSIVETAINNSQKMMKDAEEKGYNEGYLRGLVDGAKESEMKAFEGLSEINDIIKSMQKEHIKAIQEQEGELLQIAFEVAKKIMKYQAQVDENLIPKMLEDIILENEGSIKIYLSEYQKSLELRIDKSIVKRIRNISKDAKVVLIKEDDMIMVETENGIEDISVPVQLEQLIKAVENAS